MLSRRGGEAQTRALRGFVRKTGKATSTGVAPVIIRCNGPGATARFSRLQYFSGAFRRMDLFETSAGGWRAALIRASFSQQVHSPLRPAVRLHAMACRLSSWSMGRSSLTCLSSLNSAFDQ